MTVSAPTNAPEGYQLPTVIQADDGVEHALQALSAAPVIAFDTETTGLNPAYDTLLLLQMSDGNTTVVFDMTRLSQRSWDQIADRMSKPEQLWIAHNAKFDFGWLATKFQREDLCPRLYCTMIAQLLLVGGAEHGTSSLATVTKRYLGIDLDKTVRMDFVGMERSPVTGQYKFSDQQLQYAAIDAWVLPAIFGKQAFKLTKIGLTDIARLEFALIKTVSRMERRGVLIDKGLWLDEVSAAKAKCIELEDFMKRMVGKKNKAGELDFNPGSAMQVRQALHDDGIIVASTNRATLEKVKHGLAEKVLEWRKVAVLRDRYGDGWLGKLDTDNRIHAEFRQLGAATGRFSSSNPNLQQLPRGELLRKCFIAGPEKKMVTADYAAIEMRVLAEFSQDQRMIDLFHAGYDIHAATAQEMFRLPELPDKDSKHRQMAKSVNFGLVYGAGAANLRGQLEAQGISVSLAEAEHLIKLYFAAFPQAKKWLDMQSSRAYAAMDDGIDVVTTTLGGRKRVFKVHPAMRPYDRGHIARQVRNTPIQGSSADITKQAMVLLDIEFLKNPSWDAHLLMSVHDEIVVEADAKAIDTVAQAVESKMVEGAEVYMKICPVKVDISVGDHWSK